MESKRRVALVTGGMGGLGEAICIKLAQLGDTVVTTFSPENNRVEFWLRDTRERGFDFLLAIEDGIDFARAEKRQNREGFPRCRRDGQRGGRDRYVRD